MSAMWIEPPPPPRGMGCFSKGCLIVTVFFAVLLIAFIGGTYYAVRFLKTNYFPKTQVELPATTASEREQQLALANWRIFEKKARAHMPARIEMTADELNALIAANPKLRGKAYVTIEENVARLRVSVPISASRWLRGHYVNGECTVQSGDNGDPEDARITNVVVNGHVVEEAALTWRYPWSLRRYISGWTEENDLRTFEIRDGKMILETKGNG